MVDHDPLALLDRINADDTATVASDAQADPMQAEVVRLGALPSLSYQLIRKDAAADMGIGVLALDRAVAAERARRRAAAAQDRRSLPPPDPGVVRWPAGFTMKGGTGLAAGTNSLPRSPRDCMQAPAMQNPADKNLGLGKCNLSGV